MQRFNWKYNTTTKWVPKTENIVGRCSDISKKIKNEDKYTYNVGKKQKAELLLSEKIKEMEKFKKPMESNKKSYQNIEINWKYHSEIILSLLLQSVLKISWLLSMIIFIIKWESWDYNKYERENRLIF